MLLEATLHHVKANHGDDRTLWGKLFAQEKNLTTSAIARMNLFNDSRRVRFPDCARRYAPQSGVFLGDSLATFDCVIANPPFSLGETGARKFGPVTPTGVILLECLPARAAIMRGSST